LFRGCRLLFLVIEKESVKAALRAWKISLAAYAPRLWREGGETGGRSGAAYALDVYRGKNSAALCRLLHALALDGTARYGAASHAGSAVYQRRNMSLIKSEIRDIAAA
jgi:hypothetical protein